MPGDSDTTLALLDRDLAAVPLELATRRGPSTTTLNLTENRIRGAGSNLHLFTAVATLVLDKNGIESLEGFPRMPSVTTLWLNQNAISDLPEFADALAASFPNVTYLCAMMNPATCSLVLTSEEDVAKQRRYRCYLAYRLPRLVFLDSALIAPDERAEGREKGDFLAARKPKKRAAAAPAADAGAPMKFFGGTGDAAAAAAAAAAAGGAGTAGEERKKSSAFLGLGASTYDGRHSEGNRFIRDSDL